MSDPNLLAYLLAAASSLSGYPTVPLDEVPPIVAMPAEQMRREVCGDERRSCANMAAVFDTAGRRILMRNDLDFDNPGDNSFVVHELVHVLQHHARGDDIFATCNDTLNTEREAYLVQNRYLMREGQFLRYGEGLNFMACSEVQPGAAQGEIRLELPRQ